MTVELTAEAEKLLAEQMASGAYPDPNSVILAALARLAEPAVPAFDEEMLDALDEAEADVAAGRVHDWEDVRQQVYDAFTKE